MNRCLKLIISPINHTDPVPDASSVLKQMLYF